MTLLILGLVWLVCAVVTAGWFYANMAREWPNIHDHRETIGRALFLGMLYGLFGPLGLLICFLMTSTGKYGWSLYIPGKRDS